MNCHYVQAIPFPKTCRFPHYNKNHWKLQKLKNVSWYANFSDTPFDQKSLVLWEVGFPREDIPKKWVFFSSLWQFLIIFVHTNLDIRPLLSITFPQGFQKSEKFGHWTSGSGSKKTFKWYLTKMYVGMYRQTDILTYRKNQPRWPTLWKRTNWFWLIGRKY